METRCSPKKKPLDDPSLVSYRTPFDFNNDMPDPATANKHLKNIKTNHMNDNVILYVFAKQVANVYISTDYKQSLIKTITLSGQGILNLSEMKIYDTFENEYLYNKDFSVSTNSTPSFYNNDPAYGFDKLFDNDPTTFFASHSQDHTNVVFTITFTEPAGVKVGKIFIRNRMDCCQPKINLFVLNLYDVNGEPLLLNINKPFNEPSLTNYLLGSTDEESIQKDHTHDNMITYKMCRPYALLKMNSCAFTKTITITGNNWLHISKLLIVGLNSGNVLTTYNHTEDFDVTTNAPPQNDVDNMFNTDINTYFHSGNNNNVVLTITFRVPVFIYGVFLANRMDGGWKRIANFTMTVYDENHSVLTEKILDDPYLYNYRPANGKASNMELKGNFMAYIFDTNDSMKVDATTITSTRILGGGRKNGDITYDFTSKYFNYTISSVFNNYASQLYLSNYIFMSGEKYRISITCNTDSNGVLNNMYFYYALEPQNPIDKNDELFTSPILFSTPQTYTTTITSNKTGILSINIVGPIGNTFSYCTFTIEHIKHIINDPSFLPGFGSPSSMTTPPSSTTMPTPTSSQSPIPPIASLTTSPVSTSMPEHEPSVPGVNVSPYINVSNLFDSYKVYTSYNSAGVNSASNVL